MGQAPDYTYTRRVVAVRRNHSQKKARAHIVKDTDVSKEGPIAFSMAYMYMRDRIGKYRESKYNPPYVVVVDNRFGRCWAHPVPNIGHLDGAHWFPRRLIQDWDNCEFKGARPILKTDREPAMISVQIAVQ